MAEDRGIRIAVFDKMLFFGHLVGLGPTCSARKEQFWAEIGAEKPEELAR